MSDLSQSLRRRAVLRWGLELLLVAAAFAAIGAWQTRDLARGDAPAFVLQSSDGTSFNSGMLAGKPALVLFWAPWCGVCRAQSQNVSWLQGIVGTRARVISVATSYRTRAEVRAYMAQQSVDYPVLLGNEALARAFRVRAFPTAFFLDAKGAIKHVAAGYTTTLGLLWRLLLP